MRYTKGQTALKPNPEAEDVPQTEIIPWPHLDDYLKPQESDQPKRIDMDQKYLYYKGRRIPLNRFKKSGYGKLLVLLVKEIGG